MLDEGRELPAVARRLLADPRVHARSPRVDAVGLDRHPADYAKPAGMVQETYGNYDGAFLEGAQAQPRTIDDHRAVAGQQRRPAVPVRLRRQGQAGAPASSRDPNQSSRTSTDSFTASVWIAGWVKISGVARAAVCAGRWARRRAPAARRRTGAAGRELPAQHRGRAQRGDRVVGLAIENPARRRRSCACAPVVRIGVYRDEPAAASSPICAVAADRDERLRVERQHEIGRQRPRRAQLERGLLAVELAEQVARAERVVAAAGVGHRRRRTGARSRAT